MSLAANAIAEVPLGGDRRPALYAGRAPAARTITAKPDAVLQPEAR
jgi:hypothetical protein